MGSVLDFQLQGLWLKSGFCHCVFFFGQETLLQVVPLQPGCKWKMAFTISTLKNRPGIPVESRWNSSPGFPGIPGRHRADSAGIPLESAGIIAGIPPVFPWNSGHFQLEFRRIIAGIPPVFKWNCSRNSTGIIAGIPPVFHWNSSRNSAGIIAGISPVFH